MCFHSFFSLVTNWKAYTSATAADVFFIKQLKKSPIPLGQVSKLSNQSTYLSLVESLASNITSQVTMPETKRACGWPKKQACDEPSPSWQEEPHAALHSKHICETEGVVKGVMIRKAVHSYKTSVAVQPSAPHRQSRVRKLVCFRKVLINGMAATRSTCERNALEMVTHRTKAQVEKKIKRSPWPGRPHVCIVWNKFGHLSPFFTLLVGWASSAPHAWLAFLLRIIINHIICSLS